MQYEENYKSGMLHGLLTMYSVNGGWLHRTENYKEGKLHGLVQTFYEGGEVKMKSEYQAGQKVGATTWYLENGDVEEYTK